jgi:hypothetical protein
VSRLSLIYIGFDPRQAAAKAVACNSIHRRTCEPYQVRGVVLSALRKRGLYTRPTETREGGQLWDTISDAPMATEFSNSRFLVPHLALEASRPLKGERGWVLFMDCDILVRRNIGDIMRYADRKKALMVVQHNHQPTNTLKMDGRLQTLYQRKNWSSVMLFNLDHPANAGLTVDLVNSVPGRDLHRFCWLEDSEIGALPPEWNFLVGDSPEIEDPAVVHFTNGLPDIPGYENVPFADEWRDELEMWAQR